MTQLTIATVDCTLFTIILTVELLMLEKNVFICSYATCTKRY